MAEAKADVSRWDPEGPEARNLRRRAESLWNRDYVERVLIPLLDVPFGGAAVDVGTGFGALAFLLASFRPDLEITGIDPEAGLIEDAGAAARGLGFERLRFIVGDGSALPFGSGELDLAMCQTVLTHVPDAGAVVREMARVIRSGGTFFAAEWTDRALGGFGFDNVAPWTLERASETYRLTKAYSIGRAALGRGDGEAGIRCPILAWTAGLEIVDVRLNDAVSYAIPWYATEGQRVAIEEAREWLDSTGPDEAFVAWTRENFEAAGATAADAARWLDVTDGAEFREPVRAAIDAGKFAWVSGRVMVLTIARKP